MRLKLDGFLNTFVVIAIFAFFVNIIVQFVISGTVSVTRAIIIAIVLGAVMGLVVKFRFKKSSLT